MGSRTGGSTSHWNDDEDDYYGNEGYDNYGEGGLYGDEQYDNYAMRNIKTIEMRDIMAMAMVMMIGYRSLMIFKSCQNEVMLDIWNTLSYGQICFSGLSHFLNNMQRQLSFW